jgi:hypothetical protein
MADDPVALEPLDELAAADARIATFWCWFEANAAELGADAPPVAALEAQLRSIWELGWELGPGEHEPHMFVLSPRAPLRRRLP